MGAALIVIDGDTIRSDEERIRLEGIDAAEIGHAKCEAERRLGALAKHRLEQLLDSARSTSGGTRTPIPQTATAAHSPACWSTARMWDAS
jgi:endonuclease YncB( thermonuclease family)